AARERADRPRGAERDPVSGEGGTEAFDAHGNPDRDGADQRAERERERDHAMRAPPAPSDERCRAHRDDDARDDRRDRARGESARHVEPEAVKNGEAESAREKPARASRRGMPWKLPQESGRRVLAGKLREDLVRGIARAPRAVEERTTAAGDDVEA